MTTTNKEELMVGAYQFAAKEEADQARLELEKIKALDEKIDYRNAEITVSVYNRAIMNRTFRTPVGYEYLASVRERLLKMGMAKETDLKPIPVQTQSSSSGREPIRSRGSADAQKKQAKAAANSLRISVALNIVLMLLIAAMFLITLYSDNPNILNYRNKIVDEYASWEQDLKERERTVREKERELGIRTQYPDRAQDEEEQE